MAITGYIDGGLIAINIFFILFAALIFYLQREGRREGFPKVTSSGETIPLSPLYAATPKAFKLSDGRTMMAPDPKRDDRREVKAKPFESFDGAPLIPTGNPMVDGVGPAAWAERADIADVTYEGKARIVPLRVAKDFHVDKRDFDMLGKKVVGADGREGGTVRDIWVDRSEFLIRYLELEVTGGRRVLLPIPFADIQKSEGRIMVDAILGAHFANVPGLKSPDTVTLLEEEKIAGYYGGGLLYATPDRQEPLI